jgi:hypothetical protein
MRNCPEGYARKLNKLQSPGFPIKSEMPQRIVVHAPPRGKKELHLGFENTPTREVRENSGRT